MRLGGTLAAFHPGALKRELAGLKGASHGSGMRGPSSSRVRTHRERRSPRGVEQRGRGTGCRSSQQSVSLR
jgi:hypothetical protein